MASIFDAFFKFLTGAALDTILIGLIAAICTIAVRATWEAASWIKELVAARIVQRTYKHSLDLCAEAALPAGLNFGVLLVKFGADDYLQTLASENEKQIGRLRLRELMAVSRAVNGQARLEFEIPVHRRLGAQFKCYVDIAHNGDMDAARAFFERHEAIARVDQADSLSKHRLFLLLKKFRVVKTIDGLENNFLFPV